MELVVCPFCLAHILPGDGNAKLALLLNVAEEAAADAKQRAEEAKEWIDNWKGKQRAPTSASKSIETRGF